MSLLLSLVRMASILFRPNKDVFINKIQFRWNIHSEVSLTWFCNVRLQPPQLISFHQWFLCMLYIFCSCTLCAKLSFIYLSIFPSRLWGSWGQGPVHYHCISSPYLQGPPHCQAHARHTAKINITHSFHTWSLTCSWGRITTVLKSGHLSTRAFRLNGFPWFMCTTVP